MTQQYAPDFKAIDQMQDWYRNKDGNWYAYASYFYDIADTYERGGYLETHNMNFARRDIMDQLGIKDEDMQTKEGLIKVLHKVQDAKIEYNGAVVDPWINTDETFLAEQFGLDRESPEGELLCSIRQPEILEALLFYNRLYREGLITDEEFTRDKQLTDQKVSSGHVFAGITHNYLNGKAPLFNTDNNALMGGVGHIKGDSGKSPIISPSPSGGWTGTMITKNCENPDRAIRLFAFLTQEECIRAASFGGLNGYDIVDGEAVIKPEYQAELDSDPQAWNSKYKAGGIDYFSDWVVIQQIYPEIPVDAIAADLAAYNEKYVKGNMYDDKIFTDVKPGGGSELAAVQAQIDEYWKQQKPLVIMASTPEEATKLYNEAIAQMDALGMVELDASKNERFQENKAKMDVEFAWPRNVK